MKTLARWISILAHPFVMATVLAGGVGWRLTPGRQALVALLATLAAMAPIGFLMFRQVRRGHWSDVDASKASERPVLFLVALLTMAALLGSLWLRDPDSFLIRGGLVTSLMLLCAAGLNRWVKLSLHLAFACFAAVSLSLLRSPVGYALLGVLPALAWSRLALSRHRPLELVLGALLGTLAGFALVLG